MQIIQIQTSIYSIGTQYRVAEPIAIGYLKKPVWEA